MVKYSVPAHGIPYLYDSKQFMGNTREEQTEQKQVTVSTFIVQGVLDNNYADLFSLLLCHKLLYCPLGDLSLQGLKCFPTGIYLTGRQAFYLSQ